MSDDLEKIYQTLKDGGIKVLGCLFKSAEINRRTKGVSAGEIIDKYGINVEILTQLRQQQLITHNLDSQEDEKNNDKRCFLIDNTENRLRNIANKDPKIGELTKSLSRYLEPKPDLEPLPPENLPTRRKKEKSVIGKIEALLAGEGGKIRRKILRAFFLRRNVELQNGRSMTELEGMLDVPPRYLQSHLDALVKSHLLTYKPDPPRQGEPKTYFLNIADDLTAPESYDTESILRAWKYAFPSTKSLVDDSTLRPTNEHSDKILIIQTDNIDNKEISHLLIYSTWDAIARSKPRLPVYVVYPIVKGEIIRIGRDPSEGKHESEDTDASQDKLEDNIRNIKLASSSSVGRNHAEIYIHSDYYNDQIMLKDTSSDGAVKTIVITNKHRAEKEIVGKGKEVVIEDGDKIRIENSTFEVVNRARYNRKEFVKKYEDTDKVVLVPVEKSCLFE